MTVAPFLALHQRISLRGSPFPLPPKLGYMTDRRRLLLRLFIESLAAVRSRIRSSRCSKLQPSGHSFDGSAIAQYFGQDSVAILSGLQDSTTDGPHLSEQMRYLKTSEAAALAERVSPNTLRAWERRFGFPKPQRSPGKHRLFTHGEIAALRDALQEGLSISSAVSRAREGLAADSNSLVGALVSYERERADTAIEAALALRSVERSVEEVAASHA